MALLKFIPIFFLFFGPKAYALYELGFDFNYNRQVYGLDQKNKLTNRAYMGSLALYLFTSTAIEINYSDSLRKTIENNSVPISGSTFNVTSVENNVNTRVYGLGIRQALLPSRFRLRPLISLGYARRFTYDSTTYNFYDNSTGRNILYTEGPYKMRDDSVFAAFILQLKLGQAFSIKGSVRTVFPAFQTSRAKDYIEYMAGLSWFF